MGDPREPTDPLIRAGARRRVARADGLSARAVGLPELREAIAAWARRRFGDDARPGHRDHPDARQQGGDLQLRAGRRRPRARQGHRRLHRARVPGLRARRAVRARAPARAAAAEENGFLPDLDAIDDETWGRLAVLWVNYPNNPTCATAPLAFYERLAELAREHGFVLASDEAYTELWFDEPPASALQLADLTNVVVFNTLSKRVVDDGLPQRLRRRRPGADRGAEARSGRRSAPRRRSSSSARRSSRGATRSTSSGRASCTGASARSSSTSSPQGHPRRRQRGDDVPLARGAGRRDVGGLRRAPARARRARRARLVPRRRRRGLRPARARALGGGVRARAIAILEDVL